MKTADPACHQVRQVVFFEKQSFWIFRTKNSKPLWCYIKSKRQDGNGVSPLKENGQLHSDSRRKAEILNNQFCSVFNSEDTTNIPKLTGPPNTEMPKFEITWGFKRRKGIWTGRAPELDSEECCQQNISLS